MNPFPNGYEPSPDSPALQFAPPPARPNVLLVVMDATRADHVSGLGYSRRTTPHLDRLAAEGVTFEQAISPSSWSLASHASLFTGLYVFQHNACDEHKYLDPGPERETLAERLRGEGYRTWALCENAWVGPSTGLDRGFDTFLGHAPKRSPYRLLRGAHKAWGRLTGTGDSGAGWTNFHATRFLRQHAARRTGQPFFMFLQYLEPHVYYRLPRRWQHAFLPRGIPYREAVRVNQDPNAFMAGRVEMAERDFAITRDLYDGELAYMDSRIAQLVNELDRLGLGDNTLVIITSDHGENLGDHGLLGHRFCLYETLIHVPLILRFPGVIAPGQRVSEPVQTHDLVPTVYDLLGLPVPEHFHTRSLLRAGSRRDFTLSEKMHPNLSAFLKRYPDFDTRPLDRRLKAFRSKSHKLIWSSDGRSELYDLGADPHETRNLISENPSVARDLEAKLLAWVGQAQVAPPAAAEAAPPEPAMDSAVRDRLRELGYLE